MEMIGSQSPEAMFKMAQGLDDDRLTAILAGQDDALPQYVAQAVLSERQRIRQAHAGQQAQAQMEQQPQSKKDELLAQVQNTQGIAGIAPDSVAQLAGGGIIAFSGESGNQEVRADSNVYDRYNWEDLQKVEQPRASTLPEFFSNLFSRDDKRVDPFTGKPLSFGDFLRAKEKSGVENARIALKQDFTTGLPLRGASTPTPAPAQAAPARPAVAPARAGGGGGGGGRAAAPAAAAPAGLKPPDLKQFFSAPPTAPSINNIDTTNPYEKAKTADEYIREQQVLMNKYGVLQNPYAERQAELKAEQAGAKTAQDKADAYNLVQMGAEIFGSPGHWATALGQRVGAGAARKVASDKEFAELERKRKDAMLQMTVAENDIKRGNVQEGIRKRAEAEKNYIDADLKLRDAQGKREEQRYQGATQVYGADLAARTQQGVAALQMDTQYKLKIAELAQDLQLSREKIAATIKAAQISASARGDRNPIKQDVYNALVAQGIPKLQALEAVSRAEGIVRSETAAGPLAGLGLTEPPKDAVREKGK